MIKLDGRLINLYYTFANKELFLTWVLRTATGKVVVDTPSFDVPYCYASASMLPFIKEMIDVPIISTQVCTDKFFAFNHDDIPIKINVQYPSDLTQIRKSLKNDILRHHLHQSDVSHPLRVLMDNGIGIYVHLDEQDWRYTPINDDYKRSDVPAYKTLWFDTESDDTINEGTEELSVTQRCKQQPIISISYADFHDGEIKFICNDNEIDTLQEFSKILEDYDHLLSWNGDKHDIPVINARLVANGLNPIDWRDFQHIDYMRLFLQRHRSYDNNKWYLSLDEAGTTHLGIPKIKHTLTFKQMYDQNRVLLEVYNNRDIKLMIGLEAMFTFYQLQTQVAARMGTPIESSKFPTWMVESLMLRESIKVGCIWPDKPTQEDKDVRESFKGAHQFTTPGVHFNITILDWISLYNRIMQTFGISGEAYNPSTGKFDRFNTQIIPPIMPTLLVGLEDDREHYKKKRKNSKTEHDYQRYDEMQGGLKIIILLFWGVIGAKHTRFFQRDVAAQITYWGRVLLMGDEEIELLGLIQLAKQLNLKAVYGHTDSIAITMGKGTSYELLMSKTKELQKAINDNINQYLQRYGVPVGQRRIKIEVQGLYYSMFLTKQMARHAELLMYDPERDKLFDPYKLEVKGFELIKSNRETFTKEFQEMILLKILQGDSVKDIIDVIKVIKKDFIKGSYNDQLVIHASTKPLSTYTTQPPHVLAALKLQKMGIYIQGQTVDFVYTNQQGTTMNVEPVIDELVPEIKPSGIAHYWNNRIFTWLSSILEVICTQEQIDEIGEIICINELIIKMKKVRKLNEFFN